MAERGSRRQRAPRSLSSASTVERYLKAGATPRFIERALQIESLTARHRTRLARAYERLSQRLAGEPERFAERWRLTAERWSFEDVNGLIEEHNRWYPAERRLAMNPRTGDYVTSGNRDWQRKPLDTAWILQQFPAEAG